MMTKVTKGEQGRYFEFLVTGLEKDTVSFFSKNTCKIISNESTATKMFQWLTEAYNLHFQSDSIEFYVISAEGDAARIRAEIKIPQD